MSTKHTPKQPWKMEICPDGNVELSDPEGNVFGTIYGDEKDPDCWASQTIAQNIVRACNSHDELVAALEQLLGVSFPTGMGTRTDIAMKRAEAALAKARGES